MQVRLAMQVLMVEMDWMQLGAWTIYGEYIWVLSVMRVPKPMVIVGTVCIINGYQWQIDELANLVGAKWMLTTWGRRTIIAAKRCVAMRPSIVSPRARPR